MFKNKHIIVAMIVAPILAIGAYFATDFFVSEKPHLAKKGTSYKLIPKSNCRYNSGRCTFVNGNFEVTLRTHILDDGNIQLVLDSVHSLDGVKLALINDGQHDGKPEDMIANNSQRTHWVINPSLPQFENSQLRMVLEVDGVIYYAETTTTFLIYEAIFKKDFRAIGN